MISCDPTNDKREKLFLRGIERLGVGALTRARNDFPRASIARERFDELVEFQYLQVSTILFYQGFFSSLLKSPQSERLGKVGRLGMATVSMRARRRNQSLRTLLTL